jgi:hypothetical protein
VGLSRRASGPIVAPTLRLRNLCESTSVGRLDALLLGFEVAAERL